MKPVDWIVETGATYVMGVPTHAMDILADLKARGMQRLGRVHVFYMAGASIPRETAQGFLDRGILPQNVYGMTENGSHQYTLPPTRPGPSSRRAGVLAAATRSGSSARTIPIWKPRPARSARSAGAAAA